MVSPTSAAIGSSSDFARIAHDSKSGVSSASRYGFCFASISASIPFTRAESFRSRSMMRRCSTNPLNSRFAFAIDICAGCTAKR